MTSCLAWEQLNALIDGELSAKRELKLRLHLDICDACARHAAAMMALKRAVGRLQGRDVPSPALRRNVTGRMPG